jgi:4-amino-4-deoxy-L-arabinose transferase-like glycosyltransferase
VNEPKLHSSLTIGIALVLILLSAAVKCVNLGHETLRPLDESFHAVVARNMTAAPWRPTLYESPALELPVDDWQFSRVWMHKPPLATAQMALSMAVMGESTFWLRFPSVLLGGGSCVLTLLIGLRLFDPTAASLAAILQAWLAPLWTLAHGYAFSDHIDTALLFYVQLSIWFVLRFIQDRSQISVIVAGVACGLAVLSKSVVGLSPLAMLTVWAIVSRDAKLIAGGVTMLCATLLTAGPWYAFAFISYPDEFLAAKTLIFKHLNTEVELWGGPWDRVVFDYWPRLVFPWFVVVGGAMVFAVSKLGKESNLKVLVLWLVVVAMPHVLASTKTPSATVTLVPAMLLLVAWFIVRFPAAAAVGLLTSLVIESVWTIVPSFGPARPLSIMLQNWPWLIGVCVVTATWPLVSRQVASRNYAAIRIVIGLCFAALMFKSVLTCTGVLEIRNPNAYADVGREIRKQLPADAVLLVDTREAPMKMEHMQFLFFARRSSYPVQGDDAKKLIELSESIRAANGKPYLATRALVTRDVVLRAGPWNIVELSGR